MAGTTRRAAPGWVALSVLAVLSAGTAEPARAQQDPCAGVTCGAHGVCIAESQTPYCFCDEGWAALEQTCVRPPRQPAIVQASDPGARIVQLALAEDGRDLANVGRQREGMDPGPLSRYVGGGTLWCSDFVSWVYRAAGAPFTGGYRGGWLLTNNVTIRRWFIRRGAWVQRGDAGFRSFTPSPGDYVRIHTRTWGHSAIVRSVEGDTLHAIEGNAQGRVRLVRYVRFRDHERIDGFGMVRSAQSYRPRRS